MAENNDNPNTKVALIEQKLHNTIQTVNKLEDRVTKLEDRYDILYDITSSLKIMTNKVERISTDVSDMRTEFKTDIKGIRDSQSEQNRKINEIESMPAMKDHKLVDEIKKMGFSLLAGAILMWFFSNALPFLNF